MFFICGFVFIGSLLSCISVNALGVSEVEVDLSSKSDCASASYYDERAEEFITRTLCIDMSELYKEFLPYVVENGRILDAGCGSGRDALFFKNKGYDVVAIDSSVEMVKRSSSVIGHPTLHMNFEEIMFENEFDGIWANASLLHVPNKDLLTVFKRLSIALKDGGVMYFSFKNGEREIIREDGRLFNSQSITSVREILRMIPEFEEIKLWILSGIDSHTSPPWLNGLVRKKNDRVSSKLVT